MLDIILSIMAVSVALFCAGALIVSLFSTEIIGDLFNWTMDHPLITGTAFAVLAATVIVFK